MVWLNARRLSWSESRKLGVNDGRANLYKVRWLAHVPERPLFVRFISGSPVDVQAADLEALSKHLSSKEKSGKR